MNLSGIHIEFANNRTIINVVRRGKIILSVLAEITDLQPRDTPTTFVQRHGGSGGTINYLKEVGP